MLFPCKKHTKPPQQQNQTNNQSPTPKQTKISDFINLDVKIYLDLRCLSNFSNINCLENYNSNYNHLECQTQQSFSWQNLLRKSNGEMKTARLKWPQHVDFIFHKSYHLCISNLLLGCPVDQNSSENPNANVSVWEMFCFAIMI